MFLFPYPLVLPLQLLHHLPLWVAPPTRSPSGLRQAMQVFALHLEKKVGRLLSLPV